MKKISDGIWVTRRILENQECERLIQIAETSGFHRAHQENNGRHNSETFIESDGLSQTLLKRVNEGQRKLRLRPIAQTLEVYRYLPGEYIAPHRDASSEVAPGVQSKLTFVLYLNDGFEGGETRFTAKDLKVRANKGEAVLFDHTLLHEGAEVKNGTKYIARMNVAIDETAPQKRFWFF